MRLPALFKTPPTRGIKMCGWNIDSPSMDASDQQFLDFGALCAWWRMLYDNPGMEAEARRACVAYFQRYGWPSEDGDV